MLRSGFEAQCKLGGCTVATSRFLSGSEKVSVYLD